MRYNHTSNRMANIKYTDNAKCWKDSQQLELLYITKGVREHKMVQPQRKTVWQYLMKLNIHLAYDPAIPLLGSYPREMKIYIHKHLYTHVPSSSIQNKKLYTM